MFESMSLLKVERCSTIRAWRMYSTVPVAQHTAIVPEKNTHYLLETEDQLLVSPHAYLTPPEYSDYLTERVARTL